MDHAELGRQVLRLRKGLGFTQDELAEKAGISRNYVSLIERGEASNLSVNVLNSLATALGTTPAQLTGQSGWSDVNIPPALRELAFQKNLPYEVVDRLVKIPMRGKAPQTAEDWGKLYDSVRRFLDMSE